MLKEIDVKILDLLKDGWKQEEIGREVGYSYTAIRKRLSDIIYPQLGAVNTINAVYIAMKRGLIQ